MTGMYLPSTPHIYGRRITSKLKEKFWRAVPPRHNKRGVIPFGFSSASSRLRRQLVVRPRKSKVSNLKNALIADKQVCRYEIVSQATYDYSVQTRLSYHDAIYDSVTCQTSSRTRL